MPNVGVGQSRRFWRRPTASGLPPEADIVIAGRHVSKVPNPDIPAVGATAAPQSRDPHCRATPWASDRQRITPQASRAEDARGRTDGAALRPGQVRLALSKNDPVPLAACAPLIRLRMMHRQRSAVDDAVIADASSYPDEPTSPVRQAKAAQCQFRIPALSLKNCHASLATASGWVGESEGVCNAA